MLTQLDARPAISAGVLIWHVNKSKIHTGHHGHWAVMSQGIPVSIATAHRGDVASTTPGHFWLSAMLVPITAGWTEGAPDITRLYLNSNWWSLEWQSGALTTRSLWLCHEYYLNWFHNNKVFHYMLHVEMTDRPLSRHDTKLGCDPHKAV